ncbi:alpha/beta fold hydrolase [Mucilaginibacter sp. 21P]|uniref:alpha/beta fold hydrolase n=1 Tax=Mucilaginibacter sp. 21P TaxID=2778902 RepID=UPI001C58BC46|nr:alpha/beta fold hydrolase [Mucilaginibacter sp. 21P]QXV66153.1 alpha/beta fold hydrolase [Mucilaginibacter sp. 21P]
MKTLSALLFALSFSLCLFAQTPVADTMYNFGFESRTEGKELPDKWFDFHKSDKYKLAQVSDEKQGGKSSVLIQQVVPGDERSFGSVAEKIPAKFIGKTITFKAWMKIADVKDAAMLIIRIDNAIPRMSAYKNNYDQKINGTRDWAEYSVTVDIPIDAQTIYVAAVLNGPGKLWMDDAQVLIDGQDISKAKINPDYEPKPIAYGYNKAASGTVKLKDATLYYETYGQGEPLLLLHGNGHEIYAFNFQIKDLAKKFKVIAVDTRGHGKSTDESTGALTYDLFAEDMKQLLDSLHIKKTNILGWSDGGNTGLIMAVKYPQYVNKLAVMGANLFPTTDALPDTVLNEVKQRIAYYKNKTDKASQIKLRLTTLLLQEPHLTFNDIHKIKSPVLVMAGEHDLILEKHTRAIAQNIPNSKLIIFKGASHYAPFEIPKVFTETVVAFMK